MILILDANQICHQMWHMGASKAREAAKERGDENYKDATPDLADVLEWFLIRLNHLRDYHVRETSRLNAIGKEVGEPRLFAAFDRGGHLHRHDLTGGTYKANRTRTPEVYEFVKDAQEALRYSSDWFGMVSPEGYEADDLIASVAEQANEPVIIHSSDKDLNQCLHRGHVGIIKKSEAVEADPNEHGIPMGSELVCEHFTYEDFRREWVFPVARWVEYQAMVGDSSDNVKGADGIGDKKAREILELFPDTPLEELRFGMLCAEKILNKRQAGGWPEFIERLPTLRAVLTLETALVVPEGLLQCS